MLAGSPFDPLYSFVGKLLALFYAVPPHSLGLSIIILTVVVMLVQFPLIAKQTRSMIQMQRVQPEIKKLQQKYKDDRQKQNEELLKFYQENKINPLAGCLPLLVIFPIGIAVLDTFRRNFQDHIPQGSRLYADVCGKLPPGPPPGQKATIFNSCGEYLSQLAKHGQAPKAMHFLGLKLNLSARDALGHGFVQSLPYLILIVLVTFTSWYQVRQTQSRQLQSGNTPPNAQMQAVTRIMPVFFGLISFAFNTATTIYFLVSNAWRIGQQHFVLGKMYEEEAERQKNKNAPKSSPPPDEPEAGTKSQPRSGGGGGSPSGGNGGGTGSRPSPNAARRKKKRKR
jgi:YidC/Oxa1 family membrane protein insertase